MATRDVLPFTFLFLAMAAAIEASACLDHWLSERWLGAAAADLAVLLATWLVTNQRGLPEGYAPIPHAWLLAAQVALLTIYLASTIVRTLLRGFSFTAFETAQVAVAFAISLNGGLRIGAGDGRGHVGLRRRLLPAVFRAARAARRFQPKLLHLFHLRHPAGSGGRPNPAFECRLGLGLVHPRDRLYLGRRRLWPHDVAGAWSHLPVAGADRFRRGSGGG